MTYSISCVLLIPAQHCEAINALAAALGWGPSNCGVELVRTDESTWYGCHTWVNQCFLDNLADPAYASAAMDALVVFAVPGVDAASNWVTALESNALSMVEAEE